MPFTVGWHAAEALVKKQDEIDRYKRATAECQAAVEFVGTDKGKELARRLALDELKPGERRIPLEPEIAPPPPPAKRVRYWLETREEILASSLVHTGKVAKRCLVDPPKPPKPAEKKPAPQPKAAPQPAKSADVTDSSDSSEDVE